MNDPDLLERAIRVLAENWTGRATKPAPRLYPHQWSWDSAFIAIGNRHLDWRRAVVELETLFEAQWSNGMVPHTIFSGGEPGYFPSGSFWQSWRSVQCPDGVSSSGICQPPVHASAVLAVYEARPDDVGQRFVDAMVPKLVAWHDYLHRERAIGGALVEVWHPWESGRDNNPEWDLALGNVHVEPGVVPPYQRADTLHADPDDRPSDTEYDRYLYLIERLKATGYAPDDPTELPFRVRDVVMNALLVQAEEDLARLCELAGLDGAERRARGEAVRLAIEHRLWLEETGLYHSMNAVDGKLLPTRTSGAFLPMVGGRLPAERLSRLLRALERDFLVSVDPGRVPLTIPSDEIGFDANRYWRGPAWINMTWLTARGLDMQGRTDLADELRQGILTLCGDVGLYEYFDPRRRSGHGSDGFSWSAALVVDLLHR